MTPIAKSIKVSVVTACLNSAKTIGATVKSFLSQTYSDKEMIVIDGGSSDDTLAVVAAFGSDKIKVVSEPDRGIYDAMNKGLAAFTGDVVGFLNSDDRFRDGSSLGHLMTGLERADVVFANVDFVSSNGDKKVVRRWLGSSFKKGAFVNGWMPAHPTFYVRRAVVDAVGAFDIGYRIAADYDYMLRVLELHDFRSAFIDRVLVEMTNGGESTRGVKAFLISNFEAQRSRRNWLQAGLIDRALVAKPLGKITQFFAQ